MITFLLAGVTFGLSAGLFPGPLLAFVVSQSLRHGPREGFKGSLAPLVTDPPIMVVSVLLVGWFSGYRPFLGGIACLGGLFVLCLAWDCLRARTSGVSGNDSAPRSLGKAVLLNVLSPSPYLFWLLVGGPQIALAWQHVRFGAAGFVLGFFGCLVGSMALMAIVAGHSRHWITGKPYRVIMICLGLALGVAGVLLLRSGLTMLGVFGAPTV